MSQSKGCGSRLCHFLPSPPRDSHILISSLGKEEQSWCSPVGLPRVSLLQALSNPHALSSPCEPFAFATLREKWPSSGPVGRRLASHVQRTRGCTACCWCDTCGESAWEIVFIPGLNASPWWLWRKLPACTGKQLLLSEK